MLNLAIRQYRKIFQLIKRQYYLPHILDQHQTSILNTIKQKGIYLGDLKILEEMNVNMDWRNHISFLKKELDNEQNKVDLASKKKGSYAVGLRGYINENIINDIYRFALNEKLVEIIENYFEMPLTFRGVDIRKDLNDGKNIETRIWHIDGEDSKIIKILFYLENVDEHTGPFSYIEKDVLNKNNKLKKNHDGRINQEEILLSIEKEKLKKFCSNTNKFAIVDTGNIYHKGETPVNKNRYAIFFCYNSKFPLTPKYCTNLQIINKKNFKKKLLDKIA